MISIHPLRGEWDTSTTFNSHFPGISIHPLRGEWDRTAALLPQIAVISIHPLRGEWDATFTVGYGYKYRFQSTHSVGSGTHTYQARPLQAKPFQSTHSVGSGTAFGMTRQSDFNYFNPPTPWGVGLTVNRFTKLRTDFNPPTPWGVGRMSAV